jgi:hypothetical protein
LMFDFSCAGRSEGGGEEGGEDCGGAGGGDNEGVGWGDLGGMLSARRTGREGRCWMGWKRRCDGVGMLVRCGVPLLASAVLLVGAVAGCAKTPSQEGTWVGIAEPVAAVAENGVRWSVLALRMEEPEIAKAKYQFASMMRAPRPLFPILVGSDGRTLDASRSQLLGRRLQVQGTLIWLYGMAPPRDGQHLWREESPGVAAPWPDFVLKCEKIYLIDRGSPAQTRP